MMRAAAMTFALGVLASACAAAPPPAPAEPANPALPSAENDTCGAGMFAELVGKPIDGPGVPGASRLNRHILPGTQVTMDYIAQRMNIEANAQGIIQRINCG
jgi:Peptidase inhibitor I78 family